jgi:hypothetical protein
MLNLIECCKDDLGFSVIGSAQCKALGFARGIAKRNTSVIENPTIDDRARFDDELAKAHVSTDLSDRFGTEYRKDAHERLAEWCYVVRFLNMKEPTLESSLEYLKGISREDNTPEEDIQTYTDEVLSEFSNNREKAEAYVREQLKLDAVRDHDTWLRLGDEALRIVEAEIMEGTCTTEPDELYDSCRKFVPDTIKRIVKWNGFKPTITRRRELNAVLEQA